MLHRAQCCCLALLAVLGFGEFNLGVDFVLGRWGCPAPLSCVVTASAIHLPSGDWIQFGYRKAAAVTARRQRLGRRSR